MSIDWTKPVQTRDGRKVTIYTTECRRPKPVLGVVHWDEYDEIYNWFTDGTHSCGIEMAIDLVNVPEKHVRYINIYNHDIGFPTRKLADIYSDNIRQACIKIEFTEGQYDD